MPADRFDHLFIQPADFDAALAFYRDRLGWRVLWSWGGPGEPRGAGLASAGVTLVLAEPHPAADRSKTHGIRGTRPTLHLRVDDITRRHAQLGDAAQFPPEATHWGTQWFVAADPDGNLIAFEQADDPPRASAIRIFVRELAAARSFYADTLGLRCTAQGDGWFVCRSGGIDLVVEAVPPDAPADEQVLVGRFTGLSLAVRDLAAEHARLLAAGVAFLEAPEQQAWGGMLATLCDPAGNRLQLVQHPPA